MDYAVGSVAALISGNVTPNRPRLIRRALTPTKHQPSPNVTPKSELVDDRSIFLSPSLQKKKAIVKKSPKRIFENPDLDLTNDGEGSAILSPKADKVKKHLKEELEADEKMSPKSPKSPKKGKLDKTTESKSPKKKLSISENDDQKIPEVQNVNESTPKKKKNKKSLVAMPVEEEKENLTEEIKETEIITESNKNSKKKCKSQNVQELSATEITINKETNEGTPKKKKKKNSASQESEISSKEEITKPQSNTETQQKLKKKKKKRNKKAKNKANSQNNDTTVTAENKNHEAESLEQQQSPKKKNKKLKSEVNPNAITTKDSDSEHESDDEIQSENEETNKEILKTEEAESSDDEEEKVDDKNQNKKEENEGTEKSRKEEIERTLFVGNVPFSKKCKKEVKKIFDKYGVIETVRIRNVPVKDARMTPKVAAIKSELHPERTTVNVYIRFERASSVAAALAENNTVLNNNHLRVTRSDSAGEQHDPNKAIFVGNLPFAIEDETLRAKFASCGEIESVRIVRDNKTGAGKGFGYVNFASKDGVELALAMSEEDLTIKNRILRVKRCTFASNRPRQDTGRHPGGQGSQGRSQGVKKRMQDGAARHQGNFGRNQGNFNRNQSGERNQSGFGRNQGNFRNQDVGRNQGNFGRPQGNFGRNQGFARPQANEDKSLGQDGAHRRILKKRHNEQSDGGPPNKRPNINQPAKEKKPRKEFVGMTAEKKKKQKFNKGDKKKRALSEILTKHNSEK